MVKIKSVHMIFETFFFSAFCTILFLNLETIYVFVKTPHKVQLLILHSMLGASFWHAFELKQTTLFVATNLPRGVSGKTHHSSFNKSHKAQERPTKVSFLATVNWLGGKTSSPHHCKSNTIIKIILLHTNASHPLTHTLTKILLFVHSPLLIAIKLIGLEHSSHILWEQDRESLWLTYWKRKSEGTFLLLLLLNARTPNDHICCLLLPATLVQPR